MSPAFFRRRFRWKGGEVVVDLPDPAVETELGIELNPLGGEAEAIRNDAERTGRFLLDCLPSLSVADR